LITGNIIANTVMPKMDESTFKDHFEGHNGGFKNIFHKSHSGFQHWGFVEEFLSSIRNLAPLCGSTAEVNFLVGMAKTVSLGIGGSPESQ
jgi:hypothetical protein